MADPKTAKDRRIIDFLASTTFSAVVSPNQKDTFTPDQTRFDIEFEHSGIVHRTHYQCNLKFSKPSPAEMMKICAQDALDARNYSFDGYAAEMDFEKASEAIAAWNDCRETSEVFSRWGMQGDDLDNLFEYLNNVDHSDLAVIDEQTAERRDVLGSHVGYDGRFMMAFQITRMVVLEVEYGAITSNRLPHFSTSAEQFNQPKTDYARCGQCQEDVLPPGRAKSFWRKWDSCHLEALTASEYAEMKSDLGKLCEAYNYIEVSPNQNYHAISFNAIKDLSMLDLKKRDLDAARTDGPSTKDKFAAAKAEAAARNQELKPQVQKQAAIER